MQLPALSPVRLLHTTTTTATIAVVAPGTADMPFAQFIAKRFGFVRLENSGVFVCFFLSVCFCIVHGFLRNKKVGRTLENAKVNAFDVGFGWVYNLCVRSNNAIWNTKFGGECS